MAHSPGDARALESPGTAASREWMARLFDADAKSPSSSRPRRRDALERSWFNPEAHTEAKRTWLRGRADPAVSPSGRAFDGRDDHEALDAKNENDPLGFSDDEKKKARAAFSPPTARDATRRTPSGYVDDFGEDDTETLGFVFSPELVPGGRTPTNGETQTPNATNEPEKKTLANAFTKNKKPSPPFERFFVVGVPPDAKVTATAESSSAARAANAAGSRVEARRPQKKKPHRGASGVTHPARVLFAYPPREAFGPDTKNTSTSTSTSTRGDETTGNVSDCSAADLGDVESFCFPDGVATKLVERTPSMSAVMNVQCGSSRTPGAPGGGVEADDRSFVFSVGGGDENGNDGGRDGDDGVSFRETDESPRGKNDGSGASRTPRVLYGVCVYAEELVRREPGVCRAERLANDRLAKRERRRENRTDGQKEKEEKTRTNANKRERYLVSADRCYCFLSYRPAFEWHFEVLRAVAAAERFARAREAAEEMRAVGDPEEGAPDGDDSDDDSDDDASSRGKTRYDLMRGLSESFAVVAAYETFDVSPTLQRLGGAAGVSSETVAQFRTLDVASFSETPELATTPAMTFPGAFFPADAFSVFEHSADRWRTATACRVLSLETLLTAATAALLERRVVVAHPNLGELSAVVFALTRAFFKPATYTSLVLPIVPDSMLDLLEAPVPFVVGVRYKTAETRAACATPGVVRVNAYKDAVKVSGAGDSSSSKKSPFSLPALPGRQALLEALRPSYDACRSAALEAARVGAPFPYPLSVSSAAAYLDDVESDANETGDETDDATRRNVTARSAAREARRAAGAFLETWREYMHALVSFEALAPHAITDVTNAAGRVTVLMRDSFVESFRVADRAFAEALVDTQAFQARADEVLRF
jgi:hypothetical protein